MTYKEFTSTKEFKKEVKQYDLIEFNLETEIKHKCMIIEIRKDEISTLPLAPFTEKEVSPELVLRLAIPSDIILNYKKLDESTLLFLINEENPHLKMAIEKMLYNNDRKESRKN